MTITKQVMALLKTIFDTRRAKADGTYPVVYRITDFKKVQYIPTGISVHKEHWDEQALNIKKQHPNAQTLNTQISKRYYEIQKAILYLQDKEHFSFDRLKELLNPQKEVKPTVTFDEFAQQLINNLLAIKKPGNAIVYRTAINRLKSHTGTTNIKFADLTYSLLEAFKHTLTADGVKVNTISNYLRAIRAIYNKAIKAKLADRANSPFYDISIKSEKTSKRAITKANIKQFEKIKVTPNTPEWHARNYFLLSFYLIGISFTDLAYLKPGNIVKSRLEYRRRKTHKLYSIKVFPQAERILKLYANQSPVFLLPVLPNTVEEDTLESKKLIFQWIKTTNKYLNRLAASLKITEPVTTYVGRHTWATTAKKLGYSNELIAEALGHEYGNKITNIYLDAFDKESIDVMHKAVIT